MKQCQKCERPSKAKGLCPTHYNQTQTNRHVKVEATCDNCGTTCMKERRAPRYTRTFCGETCRDIYMIGERCEIPADHWARMFGSICKLYIRDCAKCGEQFPSQGATAKYCNRGCRKTVALPAPRFTSGACQECDSIFTVEAYGSPVNYCSSQCAKRVHRRARRAREHNAAGSYRFSQIMRQYALQGRRCCYCKQPVIGLPDPEHVLALSRGGCNDMSNLVASCRPCNIDKGDLTLDEWCKSRHDRHLPAVDTRLDGAPFRHLYIKPPTSPAWRDKVREKADRSVYAPA